MTFVGWLPMPAGRGRPELTADYNAEMLEHGARLPAPPRPPLFVGDPDTRRPTPSAGLPRIREWPTPHYEFSGYVTGFDPAGSPTGPALRAEFGFGDEPVCLVSVGGSGSGPTCCAVWSRPAPPLPGAVPRLRTVVVTGPRIDPASLPPAPGLEVRGCQPDLHRLLAASDVALVQGGLTTTMELTAAGRPFVYVPRRHHFEQNIHVRHRLALRRRPVRDVGGGEPAAPGRGTVVARRHHPRGRPPVEPGGAARAAALLAELL